MENKLYREFIEQSLNFINQCAAKIKSCLKELDEKDVWYSPNENLNSVANLILHLSGNIREYIISSLGGEPDIRERDLEFSARGGYTIAELIGKLEDTVDKAKIVIAGISLDNLLKVRIVQGFSYSGIGNIIHVTEHYSYHTGQIIFLTKLIRNIDMAFYAGVDLNKRNSM